jgi:hypothetical protein
MKEKLLHPATVISVIALFVALSGTTYAISQLPRNSVGAKQLRNNSVTSGKVKDRSLLAKDFKAGQLPRGEQGPKGDQGLPGEKGAQGEQGPAGPSEAITGTRTGFVSITAPSPGALVGKLPLSAGSWVVTATTWLESQEGGNTTSASCTLTVGSVSTSVTARLAPASDGGYRETVSLTTPAKLDGAGNASLTCASGVGITIRATGTRITAIRSGAVTDVGALETS